MAEQRVVLLHPSEGDSPPAEALQDMQCISAATGYEAAAEILAGGVAALVVHLPGLRADQVRVLDMARRHEVPMLGVGGFPQDVTTDDLDGMQLVSGGQLRTALARATGTSH